MRRSNKLLQLLCACCMSVSSASALTIPVSAEENEADQLIRLNTSKLSPFHDTDGDGLPEFEGWGSSLCWWANRIGYSNKLSEQAASLFFSSDGLDLNIGRYNLGGGDSVTTGITKNPQAETYGLEGERVPQYSGSKMSVSNLSAFESQKWRKTDLDLGILAGETVGTMKILGWVNGLGEEPGNGSNLTYKVQAPKAGAYTVKLLLDLVGVNDRGAMLQVNGGTVYKLSTAEIDANKMAVNGNNVVYKAVFENVELAEGENTIVLGGNTEGSNHFLHDYLSMTIVPAESVMSDAGEDPYLHKEHIIRSDSSVPGYAVDITPPLPSVKTDRLPGMKSTLQEPMKNAVLPGITTGMRMPPRSMF